MKFDNRTHFMKLSLEDRMQIAYDPRPAPQVAKIHGISRLNVLNLRKELNPNGKFQVNGYPVKSKTIPPNTELLRLLKDVSDQIQSLEKDLKTLSEMPKKPWWKLF